MKKIKVKLTFVEPVLGTWPSNQNIAREFIASILYGTPEHGHPIVGTAVILREGFVAGELDFMSLDDGDEAGLMLLFSALGICIKNESEAE